MHVIHKTTHTQTPRNCPSKNIWLYSRCLKTLGNYLEARCGFLSNVPTSIHHQLLMMACNEADSIHTKWDCITEAIEINGITASAF